MPYFMKTLDQYTGELLFLHNCVIIPGFGGFVSDYRPTVIHPVQHSFTPPAKKIAFNRKLQNDDGLLANYISEKENISFENARRAIEEQVHELYSILAEKKKLLMPSVGEFFYDVEMNLQFRENKKVNYLLESFGLETVQSPPIKREGFSESINRQLSERQDLRLISEGNTGNRKRLFKISLIAAPVLVILLWIFVFSGAVNKAGGFNYTSLIPFLCKENIVENPSADFDGTSAIQNSTTTEIKVVPDTDVNVYMDVMVKDDDKVRAKERELTASKEFKSTEPEKAKPADLGVKNTFYIVGGAFGLLSNAENLVAKLNAEGFNSSIIGKNEKGLYLVSYESFGTKKSALTQLAQIKADYDSMAWIYNLPNQ